MSIIPSGNRVAVRKDAQLEETESGIYLGKEGDEETGQGVVVAVGPGTRQEDGSYDPVSIEVGDRVIIGNGEEVTVDGEVLWLVFEQDIIGKIV